MADQPQTVADTSATTTPPPGATNAVPASATTTGPDTTNTGTRPVTVLIGGGGGGPGGLQAMSVMRPVTFEVSAADAPAFAALPGLPGGDPVPPGTTTPTSPAPVGTADNPLVVGGTTPGAGTGVLGPFGGLLGPTPAELRASEDTALQDTISNYVPAGTVTVRSTPITGPQDVAKAVVDDLAVSTSAELTVRQGDRTYTMQTGVPLATPAATDQAIKAKGDSLVAQYAKGDPGLTRVMTDAVNTYRAQRYVQDAATTAQSIPGPKPGEPVPAVPVEITRAAAFGKTLSEAPPDLQGQIQSQVDQSRAAQGLLDAATDAATKPILESSTLSNADRAKQTAANTQALLGGPMPQALHDKLSGAIAGALETKLVEPSNTRNSLDKAMQLVGALNATGQHDLAAQITPTLATQLIDNRNVGSFNYNLIASDVGKSMGDGGDPSVAVEIANQFLARGDVQNARSFASAAVQGLSDLREALPEGAFEDYARGMSMIAQNLGAGQKGLSPADIKTFVDNFYADNPKAAQARDAVTEYGRQAQLALSALAGLAPELKTGLPSPSAGQPPLTLDGEVAKFLAKDPDSDVSTVGTALSLAVSAYPDLSQGDHGLGFIKLVDSAVTSAPDLFGSVKAVDQAREVFSRATDQYTYNVFQKAIDEARTGVNVRSPSDMQLVQDRLRTRLGDLPDSAFERLGFPRSALGTVIDTTFADLPQAGDSQADAATKLQRLDSDLNALTADGKPNALTNSTRAGVLFRTLGLGLATTAIVGSAGNLGDAAGFMNLVADGAAGFKGIVDVALIAQPSLDSQALSIGGKFLGVLSAAGDAFNAYQAFTGPDADPVKGALYLTSAAGTVTMAVFEGLTGGLIGAPLVIGATLALAQYEHVTQSNEFAYQDPGHVGVWHALNSIGYLPRTALSLSDMSGDGWSALPALTAYAQSKGLDHAQTVAWINRISTEPGPGGKSKLDVLRDNLHHTMDGVGGDVSKLPATDPKNDADFAGGSKLVQSSERAPAARTNRALVLSGDREVTSLKQIGDELDMLGIPQP